MCWVCAVTGAEDMVVSKTRMVSTPGDLTVMEEDDSKRCKGNYVSANI